MAINVWADNNFLKSIDMMILNGKYESAILELDNLQTQFKSASKESIQIHLLKANALKALGRHRQALNILLPYRSIINQYSPEIAIRYYNTLGSIYSYLSMPSESSSFLQKSLNISKQFSDTLLYCETLNEIGLLYYAHLDKNHHYQLAINAFKEAIKFSRQLSDNNFRARLLINLVKVYVKKNSPVHSKEQTQSLEDAKDYIIKLSDTFQKGFLMLEIARLYELIALNTNKDRTDRIHQAHRIYMETEKINRKIRDNRLASILYFQMGGLYERAKQFDDAIPLTQKSLFWAQQTNDMYALYQNNWQLGRLYKKTGKIKKAINHYKKAIQQLSPIRKEIYHRELTKKHVFDQKIKPVYLELSEIYFNLAASEPTQISHEKYSTYIKEIWQTMDQVKIAELEDIFDDPCVTTHKKKKNLQLNSDLGDVAVIYFIPFSKNPALIMHLPNGFKHLRLDIDTKSFNTMIYRLRKDIPGWGLFEKDAAKLYELIIAPLYNDLKRQNIKTLVVASDGAMRLLPFSIFFNPRDQFLIEEFEIVTIPALHLTRMGKTNRQSPNGLLCGITQARTIGKLKFDALPRISKELETIKSIVPGDVFMDEEFTVSHLQSKISENKYSIVHLATHGEFGSIPDKTFLVTHNSKLTMNSLEKLIKQNSSSTIDLLTLSACQTAIGDERAAFGLAGGAVKAGANCAIATLWSVDDYASQKIISEFYRNIYKKNYSKAKAMQQAQLTLIEKMQFWHPAVWSAFLVIGNWY
jgi:CHAT domain-containing protein